MNTVDEYIPEPERDTDKPLLLPVKFSITGQGTVASGRIEMVSVKSQRRNQRNRCQR